MSVDADERIAFVLQADLHLLGPDQREWLDRLDQERQALEGLLEQLIALRDTDRALVLAGALSRFWWMRGYARAGRERLERVLQLRGGASAARAGALVGAGSLAYALGDFCQARSFYDETVALWQASGRELELADALDRAGMAARQLMLLEDAYRYHTQALAIQRRLGTSAAQALCLNNLGVVAFFQGDLGIARAYHHEALALREQCGDVRGKASSLNNLGQVSRFAGELATALTYLEEGLALRQHLSDRWGVSGSHVNLAVVHAGLRNLERARHHLREALAGFAAVEDPLGICECLEAAAELAHTDGGLDDAVAFWTAAATRRESLSAPLAPLHQRVMSERLAELRAALSPEMYATARQRGQQIDHLLTSLVKE